MPPKGRSKNTAGSAAQSPPHDDANTDDNTLDNPTPEDVQTVLAENRQLKERLTWLEAQFRSATPSDEASEPPEPATPEKQDPKINIYEPIHEPRIAPPKKFGGKSSEFLSFMTQCEINFLMCPKTYAKDEKKVLFIITNLEDPALQWAREIFINPKHPYRTNYEAFSKALYSLYDNHTYHQDAEDRLLSLKQMKSATTYAVEFQTLSAPLDWNDNALCGLFFKNLKPTVKNSIMQQGRATTFEALRDQAIHFDQFQHRQRVEEAKEDKIAKPHSSTFERKRPNPSNSEKTTNNHTYDTRKQRFKISWKEYERRKNNHLCFECGEGDHSANDHYNGSLPSKTSEPPTKKPRFGNTVNATTDSLMSDEEEQSPVIPSNWQSQHHARSEA